MDYIPLSHCISCGTELPIQKFYDCIQKKENVEQFLKKEKITLLCCVTTLKTNRFF